MHLHQYWKDDRLAFSTDDEVLTLTGDFAEKIWVPDTFFANDKNRSVPVKCLLLFGYANLCPFSHTPAAFSMM
jgi:hypothetical protein